MSDKKIPISHLKEVKVVPFFGLGYLYRTTFALRRVGIAAVTPCFIVGLASGIAIELCRC